MATTADTGLLVWGRGREELFANAAMGLTHLMADLRTVRPREKREVAVQAQDLPGLLVAWLNEWVYRFDAEGFIGCEFVVDELAEDRLRGQGRGETCDPRRHRLRSLVKGVTYHRLEILELGDRLRARLVVDL